MTSWTRGRENEEEGKSKMNQGNAGEKLEGAAQTAAGETEQGVNNLGDTMAGKQHDLEGHDRDHSREAGEWAEHRGDDINDAMNS